MYKTEIKLILLGAIMLVAGVMWMANILGRMCQ